MPICHASIVFPPSAKRILSFLTLFACSIFILGCSEEERAEKAVAAPDTYFPITIGTVPLDVQLALNPAEQQRGLMFRDSLGDDKGMLFLFPKPERRGFWMKNTKLPLDIGYFDATGKLIEIHPLFPYDETPVPSSSHQILIAVETNRGWFKANDVQPGATIDLELLMHGVDARGATHPILSK